MIIARKHNFSLMWLKGRVRVNDTEAGASKVKITLILADCLSGIFKKYYVSYVSTWFNMKFSGTPSARKSLTYDYPRRSHLQKDLNLKHV